MHTITLLVVTGFIAFILYCAYGSTKIKRNGQPIRRPPNTLPLLGNGLIFLQDRHKLFSWFVKCERQFGFETFQVSVPSLPPGVVINDPKNLEYILKNEKIDGYFAKGDFFKSRSWDLFGNGIINSDGELWKVQRKAGLNFLNVANLKVLTDVALPCYLQHSIQTLHKLKNDDVVNLEETFLELTTQIMGKMAYDMEMHNSDPFSAAFDHASGEIGKRFQNPLWQLTEPIFGRKFRKSVAIVQKFGSSIVRNAVECRQSLAKQKVARDGATETSLDAISGSLINSLLDSIDDEKLVADAALNYLSAGRDTTAQALTWLFYLLMRHPEVLKLVRAEVDNVVVQSEKSHQADHIDSTIFETTILPYTTAVFYETLRLYPPIPFEIKQCQIETTLPDGTFLPADSIVVWCTWAMNRSKLIWGEDVLSFKPQRWIDNGVLVNKSAFEYPVFHGGARMCLGKKMAETMAVETIATFVHEFDFEPLDDNERISKNSLTLPMQGGLPCRVKTRQTLDNV